MLMSTVRCPEKTYPQIIQVMDDHLLIWAFPSGTPAFYHGAPLHAGDTMAQCIPIQPPISISNRKGLSTVHATLW